jgi:hypothetical protein
LEKAALTIKEIWSKYQLDLAVIYNHMGFIHNKHRNQPLAIENLKKYLDIRLKFLHATHSEVLAVYNDIH